MKKLLLFLLLLLAVGAGLIYFGVMPDAFYDLVDAYAPAPVSDAIHQAAGVSRESARGGTPQAPAPDDLPEGAAYGPVTDRLIDGVRAQEEGIVIPVALPEGSDDQVTDYLLQQVEHSIETIRRELPEFFWISLGSYVIEWSGDRERGEGSLTAYIGYCYSPEEVADMSGEIDRIAGEILSEAPLDPAQAVIYFHDWIIDHAVYATDLAGEEISMHGYEYGFNIDGIFLRGRAVCEGYTKAFKFLCDRRGIPCRIVFGEADGENHSWNYVELEGRWYLVDTTWDDPVGTEQIRLEDYLLLGSQSQVEGKSVREIYRPDKGDYPALARQGYLES